MAPTGKSIDRDVGLPVPNNPTPLCEGKQGAHGAIRCSRRGFVAHNNPLPLCEGEHGAHGVIHCSRCRFPGAQPSLF